MPARRPPSPAIPRRTLLALLGALGGLAGLTACGGAAATTAATATSAAPAAARSSASSLAATSGPATSTTTAGSAPGAAAPPGKGIALLASTWLGTPNDAIINHAIEQYVQAHPGISATQSPGQTDNRLQAQLAGGTPPDLFFMSTNATYYIVKHAALALDPYVQRDRFDIEDFFPICLGQYHLGGKQYAVSYDFGNNVIFYNVDLFQRHGLPTPPTDWAASGWTYDDFLATARALTATQGGQQLWGYAVNPGERQWSNWMYDNGGSWLNADRTTFAMTDQATVDGLQFLQDLVWKYHVAPPLDQAKDTFKLFATGTLAMYTNIPASVTQHRTLTFNWDVAVRPVGKGPRGTAGGGTGWALAQDGKQKDAAWDLYRYLTGRPVQLQMMKDGIKAPGRQSVAADPAFLNDTPPKSMTVFKEAPKHVIVEPQMVNWPAFYQPIGAGVRDILDNKATPKDAVANMARQVEQYVRDNEAALQGFKPL